MESNDSPEIPDRGETSDIPGLPSGINDKENHKDERVVVVIMSPTSHCVNNKENSI